MVRHPKYKKGDIVKFKFNNKIVNGPIYNIRPQGVTNDENQVYYDIYSEVHNNNPDRYLVMHVSESKIIERIIDNKNLYLQSFIKLKHIRQLLDTISPIELCNHDTNKYQTFKNSTFLDVSYDNYYVWGIGKKEVEIIGKNGPEFKHGIEIRITKEIFNTEKKY